MITSLGYVFTSSYLRDLSFNSDGVHSLGPFVAAGERIGELSPLPDLFRGRRRCYLDVFSSVTHLTVLVLWYGACPILQEKNCEGTVLFSSFLY